MSDRAAGDTSAPGLLRSSAAANNNPLLSAAITNLTLDDFTHNAMLLPAASPFVPVAAAPPPTLMPPPATAGLSVEGSPSVVFAGPVASVTGASGLPLNPDTFSEINLDYNADDGASSTSSSRQTAAQYVASGQSATIAAVNLLPIVASTVFTSFSNIISGITNDSQAAPAAPHQPQYHNQPTQAPPAVHNFQPYPQHHQPSPVAFTPSTDQFYPQPTAPVEATPIAAVGPPPRLFSPHDPVTAAQPPSVRPPSGLPPLASSQSLHSANNTYRLNQKRKIYAPLPGLNTTQVPFQPSTDIPHQPFVGPAQPAASQFAPVPPHQPSPVASPSPFSLSALIHKVPLLDKFQQLAISPAAPVPATQTDSAYGVAIGYGTAPVYNSPVLATPPPPAAQQQLYFHPSAPTPPLRKTSTPFSVPPVEQTTPFYSAAPPPTAYAPVELQQQTPPVRETSTPFAIHNYSQPPSQYQSPPFVHSAVVAPPSVPPTLTAHLPPPPSTGSSYRLKGKPLYKSPNTYGTVATATHFQPPVAATVGPYPVAQLYDPLQSSGVPTTHAYVSAPQLPVQSEPTVPFFKPTAADDVPDLPTAVVETQTFSIPTVVPEPVTFSSPDVPTSPSNDLQQMNASFSSVQDNTVPFHPTFNQTTTTNKTPLGPVQAINTLEDVALLSTTNTVASIPFNPVIWDVPVQDVTILPPTETFTPVPKKKKSSLNESISIGFFKPSTSDEIVPTPQHPPLFTTTTATPGDYFDATPSNQSAVVSAVNPIHAFNPTTSNEVTSTPQHPPLFTSSTANPGNYFNATQFNQSTVVSAVNPISIFNPFITSTEPESICEAHPEPILSSAAQQTASPSIETVDNSAQFFSSPDLNIAAAVSPTNQQHLECLALIQSETQVLTATPQEVVPSNDWFIDAPEIEANPANVFNVIPTSNEFTTTTHASLSPSSNPIDFFNYHSSSQHQAEPFNPFETALASEPVHLASVRPRETPFDNYIALEHQTRSSFIYSDDSSREDTLDIVPNVDLPDLVTPASSDPIEQTVALADANFNVVDTPVVASTSTPVASDLFQSTHTAAPSHSTFASFFDTPVANENANNNWFNPIATPHSEQSAWTTPASHSTNTPLHKPNPTDPINFFAQAPLPVVSAVIAHVITESEPAIAASVPTAPSLDIVNNSQIANFFNNPPPLPDDATQQQLDLVKDCNRNFQASVNLNHTGGSVANHDHGSATGTGSLAPQIVQQEQQLQHQHRRLGEVAQHFAAFAGSVGVGGASSEFGIDTRSFASSNVVEPASSFQSELSEYAASLAGSQSIVGQPQAGEEDNEVQRFLEPLNQATVDHPDGTMATTASPTGNIAYRPVCSHWFYNAASVANDVHEPPVTPASPNGTVAAGADDAHTTETPSSSHAVPNTASPTAAALKSQWTPFSAVDSQRLQQALDAGTTVCTTNGGRFDVHLLQRRREPVYWQAVAADEVRRCSWFYKGSDSRLVPYTEETAALLELEYRQAAELGRWQRKVALPGGETVVLHSPNVIVQFNKSQTPESWTENATAPVANRPRIVKRGLDEFVIEAGESEQVDHLMFMVHGIGAACDLKFRTVEQVVEEFRSTAHQLVQSHYRSSIDVGRVGRIEVLPISWHSELHSAESGIDEKLRAITLESIPKLRTFTNSTLLDILFYTSPVYCQQIIDAVAGSINRKYQLYCERNPRFGGAVSLAGHSLGSVIVFDLLQNQRRSDAEDDETEADAKAYDARVVPAGVTVGQAGTGQQSIMYPQLLFKPRMFFAFGSPIGMFVTVRGIHSLGLDYKLPTCDGFYNIFHPYDPVAYRIEALINVGLAGRRPVLIPHHKGRKRMHLELRETIQRVGNDIKQRVVETFRSTMNRVYNLSPITLPMTADHRQPELQLEVDEVLERERQLALDAVETVTSSASSQSGDADDACGGSTMSVTDVALGRLNGGRRVDYVLQEAPLEFFNEYLFALTSHVCYWESADTTLFIAKEIYASMGVLADHKQPPPATMVVPPHDS